MALVEQTAIEQILQRPPDALDVSLVVGDISFFEVDPEPEPLGQVFPLLGVAEDAFETLVDEPFDAVLFDLFLAVDAQFFADLDLDGQPVRVPAGLPVAAVSPHGLVAGKQVLDSPSKAMARVRQAVGRRRAFVEDIRRGVGPGVQRFVVDLPIFPEADQRLFQLGKRNGAFNGAKHGYLSGKASLGGKLPVDRAEADFSIPGGGNDGGADGEEKGEGKKGKKEKGKKQRRKRRKKGKMGVALGVEERAVLEG